MRNFIEKSFLLIAFKFDYFFPIQTLIISLLRNDRLDARDVDVYVLNHRAWATCSLTCWSNFHVYQGHNASRTPLMPAHLCRTLLMWRNGADQIKLFAVIVQFGHENPCLWTSVSFTEQRLRMRGIRNHKHPASTNKMSMIPTTLKRRAHDSTKLYDFCWPL